MKKKVKSIRKHAIFLIVWLCVMSFGVQHIIAQSTLLGDVDSDGRINIVDALLTAQYYVGLNPGNFNYSVADVDGDGNVDIIDALLIAQFYVGLITEFPGTQETPVPTTVTSVPTQIPTAAPTPLPTDPAPPGYTLVWSDEFDNSIGPDWVFETGNGANGWGNNELEYYRRENASVSNGELVITAKEESYGGYTYTSARMKTQGRRSWQYGKIEARIKLPMGRGIWPAFWMLGDSITSVNWPACGEIDIMEHVNNEPVTHGTIHWQADAYAYYGGSVSTNVTYYHVYAIEWDSSSIKWFLDGNKFHEANIENNVNQTHEFHDNFFILLNMAVGGNWPGSPDTSTIFPASMYVDYVRVYQRSTGDATPTPLSAQTTAPTPAPTPVSGGKWTVVWEDNFDGSGQPDSSNWNYHVGNGYNTGSGVFDGWGNGEWEWYRPQNAYRENGNLVIRGDYHLSPTSIEGRDWYQFSARLTTQGKRSWQYGRLEARIATPSAPGTWPAFWMMGTSCDSSYTSNYNPAMSHYDTMATNWASCGEVDIMEHKNTESVITQNLFWDTRTGVYGWQDGSNASHPTENVQVGDVTQFHLYTIEWDAHEFRWYVDRESNPNPTKTVSITGSNQEEFHKPFFLMLNLAFSGRFTGPTDPNINDFPMYMYIDYVRVWQQQ